ncbi:MAG: peptidoglycan DD-metalloendopeptidase family protein, partial [Gloeobacterales cyanobacterium]
MTSLVSLGLYFSSFSTASATSKAIASLYKDREYSAVQDQKVTVAIGNLGRVGTFDRQPGASPEQPQPQQPNLTSTTKANASNKQKIASMSGVNPSRSDTDSHFIMPSTGRLTSSYGMRWGRLHAGIDIAAPIGTPVLAVKSGIVIAAGMNAVGHGYGNSIDIRHEDG